MATKPTLSANVIEEIGQVTVDFLKEALSIEGIVSFAPSKIGTGQVGEVYRLHLTYEASPDGSHSERLATVILKIPSPNPRSRATAVSINIYEYEARFYTDVAPLLPEAARKTLPKCFHAGFNPETALASLLLEDAGTDALVGDDLGGATYEQAVLAMQTLGLLHGALRPVLKDAGNASWLKKASWLIRETNANQAFLHETYLSFKARYESRMAPEHLDICERWIPALGWWMKQQLAASPGKVGVKHSDYRLDNLLFMPDGGIKVVDWQTVMSGPFIGDVSYIIACSLKTEDRRAWQDDLLRIYYDAFVEASASSPTSEPMLTFEEVKQEFRIQTFGTLTTHLLSSQLVDRTDRGDDMFITLITRECELIQDTNAFELLPGQLPLDNTPLRPKTQDEYPHPVGIGKYWSESWYFDFADPDQGVAGWIRLARTPRMKGNWYTATITQKGKGVYQIADYAAPDIVLGENDLRVIRPDQYDVGQEVKNGEELQAYRIKLSSSAAHYRDASDILQDISPISNESVSFDLSYITAGIPYYYRILTRYEIPCVVTGSLVINDTKIALNSAYGQRDHSWGPRDWWSSDWIWSAFHLSTKDGSKPETRFHASQLRWPNRRSISMGYVQKGDGSIQEVETLDCEEDIITKSAPDGAKTQMVKGMKMKAISYDNEEISVEIEVQDHAPLKLVSDDGRASMFDRAWGKVRASDGREGVGWFEWNMNIWE